jgi:phosphatidate phosphatase APP1
LNKALDRAIGALAKPVSRTARRGTVIVQAYRGYGSHREIFLIGRVFREPPAGAGRTDDQRSKLGRIWRLIRRWGVANAAITARFGDVEVEERTDRDGFFRISLKLPTPPPPERLWHRLSIKLTEPEVIETEGDIFIPPQLCRHVVISDIDDTVMLTGVANKLMMMWRLFARRAESRVAFPGMAAFLKALHQGPDGQGANPMLYVSRAPWSIYGVLDRFFNLHHIPVGPILFLREWGVTLQSPLPRRAKDHKRDLVQHMLQLYDDLPFVLIGDSGQRDPEIYTEIVAAHPNRVQAVYIRDVSGNPKRDRAIAALAARMAEAGSSLVLAADTMAMARHAAAEGFIAEAALADLRTEQQEDGLTQPADDADRDSERTA